MISREIHTKQIDKIDFSLLRTLHYLIKTKGEEEEDLLVQSTATDEDIENTLKWVELICLAFDPLNCPEDYTADVVVKSPIPQTRNGKHLSYIIEFNGIIGRTSKGIHPKADYALGVENIPYDTQAKIQRRGEGYKIIL